MSDSNVSDVQIQNLLAAVTDSLLAGDSDVHHILLNQHVADDDDLHALVDLIERLNGVFVPVHPTQRFVRRLHHDLIGVEGPNVLVRVRRLPPRVQLAAGIALVAGFMFISRRRSGSEARQEKRQKHAAAQ